MFNNGYVANVLSVCLQTIRYQMTGSLPVYFTKTSHPAALQIDTSLWYNVYCICFHCLLICVFFVQNVILRCFQHHDPQSPRVLHVDQGLIVNLDPFFITKLLAPMGNHSVWGGEKFQGKKRYDKTKKKGKLWICICHVMNADFLKGACKKIVRFFLSRDAARFTTSGQ